MMIYNFLKALLPGEYEGHSIIVVTFSMIATLRLENVKKQFLAQM